MFVTPIQALSYAPLINQSVCNMLLLAYMYTHYWIPSFSKPFPQDGAICG